jgi:tetratricopeptide (TPR) repeat protein
VKYFFFPAILIGCALAAGCSARASTGAQPADDMSLCNDKSSDEVLLQNGVRLISEHREDAAIRRCFDTVINRNGDPSSGNVYCTRSLAETVYYMALAASQGREAAAIDPYWSDAYFFKGYALFELGRTADARRSLESALMLSPRNSMYLCELATTYQSDKDFERALQLFADAEKATDLAPDAVKAKEKGHALRGQGFSLTELNRLDEAEAKYREALRIDSSDANATRELAYIKQLRETGRQIPGGLINRQGEITPPNPGRP